MNNDKIVNNYVRVAQRINGASRKRDIEKQFEE